MAAKRNVFLNFTDRELKIIEWRVRGIKPKVIGAMTGVSQHAIRQVTHRVYGKTGFHNLAELADWAIEHGLDAPAPPDTPENALVPPEPKKRRGRIRLGRLQRAMGLKKLGELYT